MKRTTMRIMPPTAPGRLLSVAEVRDRLPKDGEGKPLVSERWVMEHVCPRKWTRLGRRTVLNETLFEGWLVRYTTGTLTDDDQPTRKVGPTQRVSRVA